MTQLRTGSTVPTKLWPLLAALALYWMSVAVLVWQSLQLNQGYLAYPLDDSYIHMAMAKNLALHGVWGVTRHEFSSTSSSPLWTALLALMYRLFGVGDAPPLWLNLVAGSLSTWVAHGFVSRSHLEPRWTVAVLIALVFGSALPTLTVAGMEHTLHGLLTLAFAAAAVRVISEDNGGRMGLMLPLLAAALASTRYEGAFAIAVVVLLLAVTGKRVWAGLIAACGLAPILVYGAWSTTHGWYFLPNSVLLKGNVPDASVFGFAKVLVGWNAANALQMNPHLLVLVATALVVVLGLRWTSATKSRLAMTGIFVGATLLHLQFAKTGWFFRYEAYLLMLGIVVVDSTLSPWIRELRAQRGVDRDLAWPAAAVLLIAIVASPIAVRAIRAIQSTPAYTKITYDQQVQMGLFLRRYYTGRTIAVNDIGAVNYFADIRVVDLVGLASIDVARLRRAGHRGPWIESLVAEKQVDVAIVYDSWLIENGGVPGSWHKAGEWSGALPNSTVAFYAVRPDQVAALKGNLRAFMPDLPPDVTPSGEFVR